MFVVFQDILKWAVPRDAFSNNRKQQLIFQRAFTALELLAFFAIVCLLISLTISGLALYRSQAAYSVAQATLKSACSAIKSATSDPGNLHLAVSPAQTVRTSGFVKAAPAQALFSGVQLPKSIALQISYNPACQDSSCIETFLSVRHCRGRQYLYWFRRGDGLEQLVERVKGQGCP